MKEKVLITVKTYPNLSLKYDELVCTAGLREDGTWVRIYPVPFRRLDASERYKKYDWIEIDLQRNLKDFRPESHKPVAWNDLVVLRNVPTQKPHWPERRNLCLKNVYDNMAHLISEAKDKDVCTSLATFRPTKINEFVVEREEKPNDTKIIDKIMAKRNQMKLFPSDEDQNPHELIQKLPYKFSYKFEDINGKQRKLKIEDWEIGALYWNSLRRHNNDEEKACEDVRKKYEEEFLTKKDIYLFLGTALQFHAKNAPNPFIIIGVFYPEPEPPQLQLPF